IEKEYRIAITNSLFIGIEKNERRQEFIRRGLRILSPNGDWGRYPAAFSPPKNDGVPCSLSTIPAAIPVHCKITANYSGDPCAGGRQLLYAGFKKAGA